MKHKVALGLVLVAALLCSCKSSKMAGEAPKMNTGTVEIIDYQGAVPGSAIPEWVIAVGDGEQSRVRTALGIKNDTKIFVLQNRGTDLDFLKTWTDQVDARAEVSSSIEQVIGQTVQAELDARQTDELTKERAVKTYSAAATNITLNGLTKETSYWIQTRRPKTGVSNPQSASDYDITYNYYVIYTIDSSIYDRQVQKALDDVDDNDNQTEFLKPIITDKLTNTIALMEEA